MMSFQFTQPKRAATSKGKDAGIDPAFQFTQPKRAATNSTLGSFDLIAVSIHAAQAGCDRLRVHHCLYNQSVSIHAAQAGCDHKVLIPTITIKKFQFTQPKRAATSPKHQDYDVEEFQFTQPKRAATLTTVPPTTRAQFQFTQPKRAATLLHNFGESRPTSFNSRSPSGLRLTKPRDLCS